MLIFHSYMMLCGCLPEGIMGKCTTLDGFNGWSPINHGMYKPPVNGSFRPQVWCASVPLAALRASNASGEFFRTDVIDTNMGEVPRNRRTNASNHRFGSFRMLEPRSFGIRSAPNWENQWNVIVDTIRTYRCVYNLHYAVHSISSVDHPCLIRCYKWGCKPHWLQL